MNDKINDLYQEAILKLKSGMRPQIKLNQELIELIKKDWGNILSENHGDHTHFLKLKQIFCILDNSQNSSSEFNSEFILSLKKLLEWKNHELIVYCLSASQKHLIAESFKSGQMIAIEYFDILKVLLKSGDSEVKEWTLRTIESLGPLSLRLKKEIIAAKPGLMKHFNQHQKASAQIIQFLEQEWKRMKL